MLVPGAPLAKVPSPLLITFGLRKLAWLKMLKNSARNSSFNRSLMAVVLAKARSKLTYPGPRKKFRGYVPYVASEGSATTCELAGKIPGPGTHVASRWFASPHCALLKLNGLK